MKPTEILTAEHDEIKRCLTVLNKICGQLENGLKVEMEHLSQIIEFIREYADRTHHGKEEDLLFIAMEEAGIPREGGPIGVMLMDHTQGREYVQGMAEALERLKAEDEEGVSAFTDAARSYIDLLTQHIYKEDNILYPMADMRFTPERQESLLREFEKADQEKTGLDKINALKTILTNLESIYIT